MNPRYDYGQNNAQPPKVMGYDVSNNVTVTVRKLDSLGAVLDQVVSVRFQPDQRRGVPGVKARSRNR